MTRYMGRVGFRLCLQEVVSEAWDDCDWTGRSSGRRIRSRSRGGSRKEAMCMAKTDLTYIVVFNLFEIGRMHEAITLAAASAMQQQKAAKFVPFSIPWD
jgi:hypothetical protein